MFVSNQPLNPTAMFNKAIQRGDAGEAWRWAKRMPTPFPLHRALLLTVALGVKDDPRYSPAADRFLERYKHEVRSPPVSAEKVGALLGKLGRAGPPPLKYNASEKLRELAGQLTAQR